MMSIREPFQLSPSERASPLWIRLCAHLDRRIEAHRIQNDDATKDAVTTAFLRGQIRENKALRSHSTELPQIED